MHPITVAWEKRGNKAYLYRSVRTADGAVKKLYVGHGPAAAEAEREQAEARAERDVEDAAADALQADLEPLDRLATDLDRGVDALVDATLLLSGYRRHRGSSW